MEVSDLEEVLTRLVQRLEKLGRQQEVGVLMSHLMVTQLDGQVEISNETMRLYLDALGGSIKKVETFRKHCLERYFHE